MATVAPLRTNIPFVLENGVLTKEAYDFLFNLFLRVGGSLDSLNAATLLDQTWSEPAAIGNVTPASGQFTTLQSTAGTQTTTLQATTSVTTPLVSATTSVTTPRAIVTAGVTQSGGIKHVRVLTGGILLSSAITVTHTWATPFADANYTVCATVLEPSNELQVVGIESISSTEVKIRVQNISTTSNYNGTLHIIAIHD